MRRSGTGGDLSALVRERAEGWVVDGAAAGHRAGVDCLSTTRARPWQRGGRTQRPFVDRAVAGHRAGVDCLSQWEQAAALGCVAWGDTTEFGAKMERFSADVAVNTAETFGFAEPKIQRFSEVDGAGRRSRLAMA